MKKLIVVIFICLLTSLSVKMQTANEADKAALERLNREAAAAVEAGKLNDALDWARQALDLSIKVFGNKSEETALAYFNLGEIYLSKKDYYKAIENSHKALEIYQLDSNKFAPQIAETMLKLGIAYGFAGNLSQAEQYLLMAFTAAEKSYGKENKAILPFILNLRNFYVFSGDFNSADEQFVEHYSIAFKIFAADSEELKKIEEEHYCFATRFFSDSMAKRRIKRFREVINELEKSTGKPTFDLFAGEEETKKDSGKVVNSKAISLKKPSYPAKAGRAGIGGLIPVKVMIDETGKVVEAKTFCGNKDLRKVSEKAALKSKFTPTTVDGKLVKVTGYIIYNFVPRR
jgi:tetratricopeptide (TPR) repeat protein